MRRKSRFLMMVSLTAALGTAMLATAPSGFAQGIVVDTMSRSFPARGRTVIVLKNVDGRTRITAGAQADVNIRATKEVYRASSQEEARRVGSEVAVRLEQFGNRLEIEARYPRLRNWFGSRPQVLVHFEVIAPAASDLEIQSVDGPLDVDGFEGRIDMKTVDGRLTARRCSGQVTARTVDGSLDLTDVRGGVGAHTTDGSLSIAGILQTVDASSTDGHIDIIVEPGSRMAGEWSIHSSDGAIRIGLPQGFDADLDVRTGDGHISCAHPVTIEGRSDSHRLSGKINGGGNLIRIESGDGSVDIIRN